MKGNSPTLTLLAASVALALSLGAQPAFAASKATPQESEEKPTEQVELAKDDVENEDAKDDKKKEKKKKSIADLTKDSIVHDGLFTVYQSKKDGSLMMKVTKEQMDKEFIHFMQNLDGLAEFRHFRGGYRGANIYSFNRHFDKVEIRAENTSFHFDENSPLARSKDANINRPILASVKVEAEDEATGDVLIKADKIFLTESLRQIKASKNPKDKPGKKHQLGKLSKDKTKYVSIHNYPQNTDLEIEYVYDNPAPVRPSNRGISNGDFAFTDDRSIALKVRHSFIAVPENSFKPRFDDPRVGYFTQIKHDMTSSDDATPYRDVINRWNLEKKDPNAALSEPVEPIVWWIENTTPMEFREIIKDATLAWNSSFEKAGFKNAVQVKVQPDDAEWDAGDIRYNVMRWTSSPRAVFSGYGPSFANPRTGQLLGADIMLEFAGFTRRLDAYKAFDVSAADAEHVEHDADDAMMMDHSALYESALFGQYAMLAMDANDADRERFTKEFLYYLVLHEVGHTLGLNHNMKATQLLDDEEVHDKSITDKHGLQGSVMDYPSINFAPKGVEQGAYYTSKPGAYDDWAIEFGYAPALTDMTAEKQRIDKLLARSTEPALTFGNDADDMRSPGKGIDPRVMIYDMSSDAVSYAEDRLNLVNSLMKDLKTRFSDENESYQALTNAFVTLQREYARNAQVVSRYIGGVYVDRGFVGQEGAKRPFTPVEKAKQKQAMDVLNAHLFAPDAFEMNEDLISHLQQQRRGFYFFGKTEDPKLHDMVLSSQKAVMAHLLHPNVLKRIQDSSLYGNEYSLADMMGDLTEGVFKADAKSNVNSFRQNLQRMYVEKLAGMLKAKKTDGGKHAAQALARYNLKKIKTMLRTKRNNAESIAHKEQLDYMITKALDPKAS
ncbi:zinc-dependent metalloprotease [Flocculibacter collagenilyticus]|uniref:zinc-dependent metalloprotease n=1 Tax=Flocculibacter collagenilyticus TaxID=2744479 RepID=UPI0018F6923A|nr:zinc-dependent metalloprotease [Flocculibacter collagenilyticus]